MSELTADLSSVEEQLAAWEESRRQFARIAETVDQLSRVSGNLQQSVLDTRMVPVASSAEVIWLVNPGDPATLEPISYDGWLAEYH